MKEVFKDYITEITGNPEKYGLHSLRAGGISCSQKWRDRLIGVEIRPMVFRKKAINGYMKDSVWTKFRVSKMLGL